MRISNFASNGDAPTLTLPRRERDVPALGRAGEGGVGVLRVADKRCILRRSFLPKVLHAAGNVTPQGLTMLMARPTLAGVSPPASRKDTPRRERDAATSRLEALPRAALYALNQPVQRDQAAGVSVLRTPPASCGTSSGAR